MRLGKGADKKKIPPPLENSYSGRKLKLYVAALT